ncbi:MAG TPA: type II toxin-antitoxin system RelE/ParE family toxin [Rhizomicrobium sp.]|nr:type II toxin-antitoxin system RelE/ParE family toxin [Rhizomicrobium sp.]
MAQYLLSDEALRDLVDLEDFLTNRESRERAISVIARLHRAMTSIAGYPGIGRKRLDLSGSPMCFPVQSWLVFYRPTPDRTGVEIIRVIDARRDIETILARRR